MASSKCSIDGCKRTSDTLCAHRQSQVCTKHYIEHVKEANQELASFSDDLNSLVDLCQQQQPPQRALEQLEQWRDENHRRIDQIYEEKLQTLVEEQMDEQLKRLRELSTQEACERIRDANFVVSNGTSIEVQTSPTITPTAEKNTLFVGEGTLLSTAHQARLNEWIGNHEQKWKLLYKATRDGFESAQLHRCCDNSGPTITVVESNNGGYLLGGYTSVSWHSSGIFIEDHNNPFLFTLTNPCGIEPTKYSAVLEKYAIYAHRDYGPTFGGGHDLFVANSSDKNRHSSANFPHSYHDTTARGSMTFTGGNHFQPSEIEVYRLLNS